MFAHFRPNFAKALNMKDFSFVTGLLMIMIPFLGFSQEKITVEEYISLFKDLAIKEMETHHIPASVTMAQGILESDCGNSPLAKEANNHFGIKCHKEWTGDTFFQDDDEKNECFRKYRKPEDSYDDHSDFLVSRDRYNFLFEIPVNDYKGWAYGLKQAGYATNPRYPELLIRIIEENELYLLDQEGSRELLIASRDDKNSDHGQNTLASGSSSASTQVYEISGKGGNGRMIFLNNGVKFILARDGDDFYRIAEEFGIYSWQIWLYNDMARDDKMLPGQKVYLERKKGKSNKDYYQAGQIESLYSVSQEYGIRLKALCRMNGKPAGYKLEAGEKIRLR